MSDQIRQKMAGGMGGDGARRSWRNTKLDLSLHVLSLVSVVGICVMLTWLNRGGPGGYVRAFASSIWLACLSLFFTVDGALASRCHGGRHWGRGCACGFGQGSRARFLFTILVGVALVSMLGYGMAGRWAAVVWALVLSAALLANVVVEKRAEKADRRLYRSRGCVRTHPLFNRQT